MARYLVRRLLLALVTAFLVTIIVFASTRLLPGDVVTLITEGGGYDPARAEELRDTLGLNDPVPVQYVKWLSGLLRGDLGESLWTGSAITEMLRPRIAVSLELAVLTLLFGGAIGVTVGTLSAVFQDTWPDYILRSTTLLFISVPYFWLAILTVSIPAALWGWSPPLGYEQLWVDPRQNLSVMWLPALILGISLGGTLSRMQRSAVLEVLRLDYVRTARAKGLREVDVIRRHVLKNGFIPVLTILGLQAVFLLGGSVIVETVYSVPGIGSLMLSSLNARDFPVVQAITLVFTGILLTVNLVIDIAYVFIDPRIRLS